MYHFNQKANTRSEKIRQFEIELLLHINKQLYKKSLITQDMHDRSTERIIKSHAC